MSVSHQSGSVWNTTVSIKESRNSFFHNLEEVNSVSEPNLYAKNDGDSLEVQFWARSLPPRPWMSMVSMVSIFRAFLAIFLVPLPVFWVHLVRIEEIRLVMWQFSQKLPDIEGYQDLADFWRPWMSIMSIFWSFSVIFCGFSCIFVPFVLTLRTTE